MTITIIILALTFVLFFIVYSGISQNREKQMSHLESKRNNAKTKFQFMMNHRRELQKSLQELEHQLATLRNSQEGIRTISVGELGVTDIDDNEKVSRYLLQEGKITLEQSEKVLKKMEILQMDYVGVCLTLGIIDLPTAKRAIKINKISSTSPDLN